MKYFAIILFTSLIGSMLSSPAAADDRLIKDGHIKYRFLMKSLPDDSLFLDFVDTPVIDHNGDLRLRFDWQKDKISLVSDYQLIAQYGDSFILANNLPGSVFIIDPVPDDALRLFDLTQVISDGNNHALTQRLDRLYIEYAGDKVVTRLGRQAISWGNGLVYTPMDFINPFDPSTIDKEYKTGDDMLYSQYLQQNGNDLQLVWGIRRNLNGEVTKDVDTLAAKYHGFAGNKEYDLLLAQHFEDDIIGFGGITDVGSAIWRGDITLTRTSTENVTSLVTSLSYSWVGWGRNISGIIEYFYNGFGQTDGDYSPVALVNNPNLVKRIQRGELFTLGRQYLMASANVEITPPWIITPNIFINASDQSFLTQIISRYDFKQDWQLLTALSLPIGDAGTEYGGINSGVSGKSLSTGFNLFMQLAWYF